MRRDRYRWDVLAVACLAAVAFHALVVVPQLLMPLLERREAPIEVAYIEPATESPLAEAETPEAPPPLEAPTPEQARPPAPEQPLLPAPEPARVEPPAPGVPPPLPPPPPPVPVPTQRMTMVDQDLGREEADNPNAKYLAQKSHHAAEDTRTLATNLVRNQQGETVSPSEPSTSAANEPGMRDHKTAELEAQAGRPNQIVRGKPLLGDEGQAKAPPKPGRLAMRDLTPSASSLAEVLKREGLELPEEGPGPLPPERLGSDGERAAARRKGGPQRVRLQLDHSDYDRIEGEATAESERRRAARAEVSHTAGRWDKVQQKMAMMRSSLENFTPAARVGNQAELGTRAHPFAAYIAGMHRTIHKLWAYGFLVELDGQGPGSPMSDMERWTQLEIVLKRDGAVEKVNIVRPSGYSPFDAAAIDAVISAGPYDPPPDSIRSVNGKVYLDWRFHRDDRQCGTFGVDPHILTSVAGDRPHDVTEVEPAPRIAPPRVLHRAPPTQVAPSAPSEIAVGDDRVPDGAKDAAEGWFAAYVRGDVAWLAGWSAVPLTAGGAIAAVDAAALKKLYAQLLDEAPGDRRLDAFEILTAGEIRKRLGSLPPGGESGGGMYFAVGEIGKERFVLLLKKSDAGYRVAGIAR